MHVLLLAHEETVGKSSESVGRVCFGFFFKQVHALFFMAISCLRIVISILCKYALGDSMDL
jgi:hypothetical protein